MTSCLPQCFISPANLVFLKVCWIDRLRKGRCVSIKYRRGKGWLDNLFCFFQDVGFSCRLEVLLRNGVLFWIYTLLTCQLTTKQSHCVLRYGSYGWLCCLKHRAFRLELNWDQNFIFSWFPQRLSSNYLPLEICSEMDLKQWPEVQRQYFWAAPLHISELLASIKWNYTDSLATWIDLSSFNIYSFLSPTSLKWNSILPGYFLNRSKHQN